MTRLSTAEIAEIRERVEKATPGEWRVDGEGVRALVRGADSTIVAVRHRLPREIHEANFQFIAAARTDVPRLLSHVSALEEENARLRAALTGVLRHLEILGGVMEMNPKAIALATAALSETQQ